MFKQAVSFLSREWERTGHIDVRPILHLSGETFSSEIGSLSLGVVDLMYSESEYATPDTPATTQQQVQIICSKISWRSEAHPSDLHSLMRASSAFYCCNK